MVEVLIADDHPVVRQGLKQIMSKDRDVIVADEAADGHEVLQKVRQRDYDVVLLDVSMPGLSGIEVLKQLRAEKSEVPVLMLSVYPEEQIAVRVLRAGANGYLTKEAAPEELINAVRTIVQGEKYISAPVAQRLATNLTGKADEPPHASLSDREYSVLCLLVTGRSIKEIAEDLTLSVKTIHTYRSRILNKMKMKSNSELVRYALSNGLYPKEAL
jgi:DNA-binding NarL/FixJ family response regulator